MYSRDIFLFNPFTSTLFIFMIIESVCKVYAYSNEEIFQYITPDTCKLGEYFNAESLICAACDLTKYLEPSEDRLTCVCNKQSKFVGFQNGCPKCELCGHNEIPTIDGLDCVACSTYSNNSSCECASSDIRLERNVNGSLLEKIQCIPCTHNTYPSPDGTKCLTCRKNAFKSHINCPCPLISHLRIKEYCVDKNGLVEWPDIRSTYLVKYESQQVDSYYLRTELQLAVYLCKSGNKTACEHVANMCALTLFINSIPCRIFLEKHNTPLWLYYGAGEAPTVLNQEKITQKYSLDTNNNNSQVNIASAIFSTNGQFQSISTPDIFCDLLTNIRFGINTEKFCVTTAKKLSNMKMEFFEPYLRFTDGRNVSLYPLPVLIRNTNKEQTDASGWRLVRRFFIIDTISGIKALPSSFNTEFKRDKHPSIMRYAKSIHLLIKVQNKEDQGKIFPPLIILEYDELPMEHIRRNVEVKISYRVTYILANDDMYMAIEVATGVLSGLGLAFAAIKAWSYSKRNGNEILSASTFLWFLIFCCGILGNIFIFVSFCASVYTFIFYKGQTVLHVLLPSDTTEEKVRIFVIVAFCLKLVETITLVYRFRNLDIFFIDWEQPRSVLSQPNYDSPHTSLKKLYAKRFPDENPNPLKTPSDIISARRKRTPRKSSIIGTPSRQSKCSTPSKLSVSNFLEESFIENPSIKGPVILNNRQKIPVSIWRTYFIANEWFRIQTMRKVNVVVQGIATLFILEVLDIKFWARPDPDFTINAADPMLQERESFTLKFGVGTLVYISVHCAQWLIMVTFYERYIKNHIQEFVDLCSMANISVFILSQNRYGFYIHGRSVHGFADTDLATLINNLKQEEENLCAHRGLLPGTTEQSFVISVSKTFRDFYDKIMSDKIINDESRFFRRKMVGTSRKERNVQTYQKMTQFLTQFVDHCFKDLNYLVREKRFLEKLLDIEFTDTVDGSVFHIDNNHSFDRVMFYGNEWTLVTFEITLFNFVGALFQDYTLAIIITVLVSQLLVVCRKYNGKKNLANKTLIDERFLL
ncbi:meckelin [Athalia rosae]|uniref:meckelin n=1 Tax=Athalia rosae TaxID=37344 RepID=UPI0020348D2D|nr:meckelin [Athalia rosae]